MSTVFIMKSRIKYCVLMMFLLFIVLFHISVKPYASMSLKETCYCENGGIRFMQNDTVLYAGSTNRWHLNCVKQNDWVMYEEHHAICSNDNDAIWKLRCPSISILDDNMHYYELRGNIAICVQLCNDIEQKHFCDVYIRTRFKLMTIR